jgi:hypothetical protein
MQKLLFSIFLLSVFFIACQQDSKNADAKPTSKTASPEILNGHWIAMDFCSRANQFGSVLAAMNNAHKPYAYALTFNPSQPDSVTCFNGIETWNLLVKYKSDTLELVGARQGKSIFLVYNSLAPKDNDITMFDVTQGSARMDKFIKSKGNVKDGYQAFLLALNHNVFGGVFLPAKKGGGDKIQFAPDGSITGFKDFDRYEICTGGDCFVAGQDIDVVTFSNSKIENSEKLFGYRFDAPNETLTIFNLINKNPGEKGAFTIGNEAYKFVREKPAQK